MEEEQLHIASDVINQLAHIESQLERIADTLETISEIIRLK